MKTINETKERLLRHIESVESIGFLEVIEEIVFHISRENDDFELSETDLLELERRRDDYLSGKDKGITFEEVKARIYDKYGF